MRMRWFGLLIALLVVAMTRAQAQAPSTAGPVHIPGPGEGYEITPTNSSQPAPSGFEGRTDISTVTAVGNTPATTGKRVVARFTLGNQVRTCPQADGTAEGEGVFSITVDLTDAQASGTNTTHIDMRAKANYKGQVGDNAYLDDAVKAEIDYSYTLSGTMRGTSGALATPAGSKVEQHITIPVMVARDLTSPTVGAFAGGDPTKGHYSEALSVGIALTYWAGVYYSVAQTKWRQGNCVQISFNPPSNTKQPALGIQATVQAEVKTKRGESVKAQFQGAHAYSGGRVTPGGGRSDVGSPLTFTYLAPPQKASNAGFGVSATSRAGVAEGEWKASLGTGWSGQISCIRGNTADPFNNESMNLSDFDLTRMTIDVKDGVGTLSGYAEQRHMRTMRRPVARGGYIFESSDTATGVVEGTGEGTVVVDLMPNGTYSINPQFRRFIAPGKMHSVHCDATSCRENDLPFSIQSCLGGLYGKFSEPNQLHGSMNDVKPRWDGRRNVTQTWTVTWDLARQGTSR